MSKDSGSVVECLNGISCFVVSHLTALRLTAAAAAENQGEVTITLCSCKIYKYGEESQNYCKCR